MFVPIWFASVVVAAMGVQLVGAIAWAIHADKRLALMEQSLLLLTSTLSQHNLAVLNLRINTVEAAVSENVMAHGRNRSRIEALHAEVYTLFGKHASASSSGRD